MPLVRQLDRSAWIQQPYFSATLLCCSFHGCLLETLQDVLDGIQDVKVRIWFNNFRHVELRPFAVDIFPFVHPCIKCLLRRPREELVLLAQI